MASPTSRLLELLELLQTRPLTTGREIADRLGVDARTARRYVGVLQELGIPVEGQRGVGGGYRIRPGYRLPPLMLADEEAVVVVLGLLANRGSGDDSSAAAVDGALAKINRVLPVDAAPPGGGARGDARLHEGEGDARRPTPARCCCSRTRSAAAGGCTSPIARSPETSRSASSARTASSSTAAAGTWPRTTTCGTTCGRSASTGCGARRSMDAAALPPPADFDPVEHVTRSLASVPWKWEVEVLLDLPVDEAARRIPPTLAEIVDDPTARCCGCGSTRSTGWRPSSPSSAAASRSGGRTSCGRASAPWRRTWRRSAG